MTFSTPSQALLVLWDEGRVLPEELESGPAGVRRGRVRWGEKAGPLPLLRAASLGGEGTAQGIRGRVGSEESTEILESGESKLEHAQDHRT